MPQLTTVGIQVLVATTLFATWATLVAFQQTPVEPLVGFIATVLAGLAGHLSATYGKSPPTTS